MLRRTRCRVIRPEELNNQLPIVPHTAVAKTDCPGYLVVGLKDNTCEVLCNDCGALIGSMSVREVEGYFQSLYKTGR